MRLITYIILEKNFLNLIHFLTAALLTDRSRLQLSYASHAFLCGQLGVRGAEPDHLRRHSRKI